jgi:hypothetical protein
LKSDGSVPAWRRSVYEDGTIPGDAEVRGVIAVVAGHEFFPHTVVLKTNALSWRGENNASGQTDVPISSIERRRTERTRDWIGTMKPSYRMCLTLMVGLVVGWRLGALFPETDERFSSSATPGNDIPLFDCFSPPAVATQSSGTKLPRLELAGIEPAHSPQEIK